MSYCAALLSRRTLSDIERGTGSPSIALLNAVFKPLGLQVGLLPRNPALMRRLMGAFLDRVPAGEVLTWSGFGYYTGADALPA